MRIISEQEFSIKLRFLLSKTDVSSIGAVTGPGRSGAVAAIYTSHILGVPFIPYGQKHPENLGKLLVIDTATESGKTLRKAGRKYKDSLVLAVYHEPPRVAFWYEANKPQRYKHENSCLQDINYDL